MAIVESALERILRSRRVCQRTREKGRTEGENLGPDTALDLTLIATMGSLSRALEIFNPRINKSLTIIQNRNDKIDLFTWKFSQISRATSFAQILWYRRRRSFYEWTFFQVARKSYATMTAIDVPIADVMPRERQKKTECKKEIIKCFCFLQDDSRSVIKDPRRRRYFVAQFISKKK